MRIAHLVAGFAMAMSSLPLLAQPGKTGIVIDSSSPIIQIVFDHAGDRKPLSEFEPPLGLWLRLKNNCTVPIRVMTFEPGTTDPGVGISDEVVLVTPSDLLFNSPGEAARSNVTSITAGKGYSHDAGSPATVSPGKSLLFSVPLSHVGPTWLLRIRFEFELPAVKSGRQPYAFVDFTWSDVPSKFRHLWTQLESH